MEQADTGELTRIGGWLFRRRTIIPLPLALAVLLIPSRFASWSAAAVVAGLALVAMGEGIRVWGVRHIGSVSRTRSERLGPLVDSGPFAIVRNPLYVGNVALWVGFAVMAGLLWLAPVFILVLGFEYHAIVRWEERLLEERLGNDYRDYAAQVPRWIPGSGSRAASRHASIAMDERTPFSWRSTLYSERGTLIAITVGLALLWGKRVLL